MKKVKTVPIWHLIVTLLLFFAGNYARAEFYTQDVSAERSDPESEVFLFQDTPPQEITLRDKIFNTELSNEFRARYIDKFGTLDTESALYHQDTFQDIDPIYDQSQQFQDDFDKRKSFAEYMVRRVTEWHFDHYFKSEPGLRPIYDAKEAVSHVEVKIQQTKFNGTYNFSSNIFDLSATGGMIDTRYSLEMTPHSIGPSGVQEQKVIFSKEFDSTWSARNTNAMVDGIAALEVVQKLKSRAAISYLTSTAFHDGGTSVREGKFVVGYSRTF